MALVAVSIAISSCGPQDSTLSIYNWSDYIGDTTIESYQQYENTSILYSNYSSNEEMMAKLSFEPDAFDLVFPSGYAAAEMKRSGMLQKLDKALIPNLVNLMEAFRSPYFDTEMEYCVPYTWSPTGIGYNSDVVSAEEAASAGILFNGNYPNMVTMLDDSRATLGIALKYLGYSANSSQSDELNEAAELLVSAKPSLRMFTNDNIPSVYASEEVVVGYGWSGDIMQAAEINPRIKFSIPEEGSLVYVDYMCIPSGSDNADEAAKFINHILDPNVSLEIATTTKYATTNMAAFQLATGDTIELWSALQQAESGLLENVIVVDSNISLYDDAWRAVKDGGN